MPVIRPALRERLRALLRLDDPPWRIALALAVGVFIGCTPFWLMQTVLALVVATVFRLNKAATVTGVWLNLPWFAPFVYAAALKVGSLVTPAPVEDLQDVARRLTERDPFAWRDLLPVLADTSVALLIGTTLVGAAAAVVTYVVAVRLITARRAAVARRPPRRRVA